MRILVVGEKGFIGGSCVRFLKGKFPILTLSTNRDLTQFDEGLASEIQALKPDAVILAAGARGRKDLSPTSIYEENCAIQENVIKSCAAAEVGKLLFLSSSAIYEYCPPKSSHFENSKFGQNLEPGYGLAKKEGMDLCMNLNSLGYSYQSLIIANVYGAGDRFNLESALLVPRLIKSTYEAIKSQGQNVVMNGSPYSLRDYLHIEDLLSAVEHLLLNESKGGEWNIGTGVMTSNYDLANLIGRQFSFKGEYIFDTSAPPDGLRPKMNVNKIHNSGWKAKTSLTSGVERTVNSYLIHSL